jgi:hypothetical protein
MLSGKPRRLRYHSLLLALFLILSVLLSAEIQPLLLSPLKVHAQPVDPSATIAPANLWGPFFGTSGDVEIDVNQPGIAVRVEIPREFMAGVVQSDNDTHFIQSNIRNDYYYYSVIDEAARWTYAWKGAPSDGPCFKPNFSLRDPNAPWCVEIWNYLNGTFHTFTPPKFIRFHNLNAPSVAGRYNFTLFVADHTNSLDLPDFVHAFNTTLFVPVSARDRPASISGLICDNWFSTTILCGGDHVILGTKAVAYAKDLTSGQIVGRSYVNETTGRFNITGLAPTTAQNPVQYQILTSAGYDPTYDTAYSLTAYPLPVTVGSGENRGGLVVALDRSPQVCGQILYESRGTPLGHSITDHPYLPKIGLEVLNVTVEALDPEQHVYRNMTLSQDSSTDSFRLITGSNVTYVGTDPYGTEFAGLPQGNSTNPYTLTFNVYVTGYVQVNLLTGLPEIVTATVDRAFAPGVPAGCITPLINPIPMQVGGVISGTIQLWDGVSLETPSQAERDLPLRFPPTDSLFGGNILLQAFDHLGILRAVSVINGTYPNGTTIYRNSSSIRFILFGFSEYFNHTWSGVWDEHDNGLPPDPSGYSLRIFIRGYELDAMSSFSLFLGGNVTVTPKMTRGGAFQVGVFSYDNRVGSRAIQAQLAFRFLNLALPVRARTYFYTSGGAEVGYVECLMRLGVQQPDPLCRVQEKFFTVTFAGQNWNIPQIWFYGGVPTHVTNDTYTVKAYTLGYIWPFGPTQVPNDLVGFAQVAITLLRGNQIDITGPVFRDDKILGVLPENEHAIGQALSGGLKGATPSNLTEGTPTLILPIFGFGGMTNSTGELQGQGHFFYAEPTGHSFAGPECTGCDFDYGLDNGTYTAQVPEFGFSTHFMEPLGPSTVIFRDLYLQTGVVIDDFEMAKIISDVLVTGDSSSCGGCTFDIAPLSWVQVSASNSSFQRTVTTLDGHFTGPGALFLPAGLYDITYSLPAYYTSQTLTLQVQWGSTLVSNPPSGALCPLLAPATSC